MGSEQKFSEIEKRPGPPDVTPVDVADIDRHRSLAHSSLEQFLRQRIIKSHARRQELWQRDYSSVEAYRRSLEPMRRRLKEILGYWIEPSERPPVRVRDQQVLYETPEFRATRFTIPIADAFETYGIELIPAVGRGRQPARPRPGLLVQHGYGGCPELVCGFTKDANSEDYSYRSLGLRAAKRGFHVVAIHHPAGYGSAESVATDVPLPDVRSPGAKNSQNRLHRLATLDGGTLFGLYMLASSRGVDLLLSRGVTSIGMYGLSQGGTSALFLPAIDERISASVCSAYFNQRLAKLIGPHRATCYLDWQAEDIFLCDFTRYFGDSDLVSLIAPRAFAVEAGVKDTSVDFEKSTAEFDAARVHYQKLGIENRIEFIAHAEGHVSATRRAFEFLELHVARAASP